MRTFIARHQERLSESDWMGTGQPCRFRTDFRLIPGIVKYGVMAQLMTDENE